MASQQLPGHKDFSRIILTDDFTFSASPVAVKDPSALVGFLRADVIGSERMLEGPIGERKITYCDFTASGRALATIEGFVREVVLPVYSNTHTTTSTTGHQSSLFRHEARLLLKRLVNANFSHGNDKDCLLFHGSGVTGCINLIVHALGLLTPPPGGPEERAVVFVGPFEHHSNLLPWREAAGCEVVVIQALPGLDGMDLNDLERQLVRHAGRRLLIGSFSAASNVTGALTDTVAVSTLLHRHGALAFWDFAAAGPYVRIDMNPRALDPLAYMDAVFLSPHKFLGGPGSPGVVVIKKRLLPYGRAPAEPGGGTVFFVTDETQRYARKAEERYEGGTPDIVGSVRAALAFKVKAAVGEDWIAQREAALRALAMRELSRNPAIVLLSRDTGAPALPIVSFVVQHRSGRMLHFNFVCALLNDLFGIQLRGGCMCAGPFAERLLGMSQDVARAYEAALVANDDSEILRPGFARLSLHYTMSDETASFVLRAIDWVATHGWRLLPEYVFESTTAEWYHPSMRKFPGRRWLADLAIDSSGLHFEADAHPVPEGHNVEDYFAAADAFARRKPSSKRPQLSLVPGTEHLRWFVLPQEIVAELGGGGAGAEDDWTLGKSPLRTFVFASEAGASGAVKPMVAAPAAAAAMDDFLGWAEDGDEEEAPAEAAKQPEEVAAVAPAASGEDGAMCTLRPEWREPIDLGAAAAAGGPVKGVTWHVPDQKKIWKKVRQAIFDFDMIRPGDRVLVCVSGGKDSLSLLHTLHFLRSKMGEGVTFELGAVTVDPMTVSFDPRPLIPYMAALGVTYHYEQQPLIDAAKQANASSICSWCSRMKRGIIYKTARTHGYNVVAMGQHLDDLAESFMMSLWLNGKLRTQKACYVVDEGDLRFIRPLVYVRERDLKDFAVRSRLPVVSESCPACFAEPKERARLKQLLENQELLYPHLYNSMAGAMDPLMRNLPITAADHAREAELRQKQGLGRSVVPSVLSAACVVGVGVLLGFILKPSH